MKKMHFYKRSDEEKNPVNDVPTTVTEKADADDGVVLKIGDRILTKIKAAEIDDVDNEIGTVMEIVSDAEIMLENNETGVETSVTLPDIY